MPDAHRAIDDSSERVRLTLVQWTSTGDLRLAEQLVPLVERFGAVVDEHFDDEERTVVPLIAEYLNAKEWRKFLAHGSAFVRAHPRRGLVLGAIVLDGQPTGTRERFLANVPLFARTAYRMFGERLYTVTWRSCTDSEKVRLPDEFPVNVLAGRPRQPGPRLSAVHLSISGRCWLP